MSAYVPSRGWWIVVWWSLSSAVSAQPTTQPLPQGELHETQQQAKAAILQGGASPEQLIALYESIGRAAAREGDEESASVAFVRLLALAPSYRLPPDESDVVRSRFMEARGFWSAHSERLAAALRFRGDDARLLVSVTDPAQLAARVRVRWREAGQSEYLETVRLPGAKVEIPVAVEANVEELEVALALLDEHGNRLLQHGSDAQPETLRIRAPQPAPSSAAKALPAVARPVSEREPNTPGRRRFVISAGVMGGLAVLAGGGALGAYFAREQHAQRWNEGACDGPGVTRATRCADERSQVTRMERLSIGLAAAGGAALIGSAVLFWLAPQERAPTRAAQAPLRCHGGPGELGLGCTASF